MFNVMHVCCQHFVHFLSSNMINTQGGHEGTLMSGRGLTSLLATAAITQAASCNDAMMQGFTHCCQAFVFAVTKAP
jgi:hypothetical protein